jgi:hypothetical protein
MTRQRLSSNKDPRWIQDLSTDDTVEESEGTFSENSTAEEIAVEVKRKSPDFQAAVAKIQLYLNRAGKRLSQSRRKEIKRAQKVLRNLYHRTDREKANKAKRKANMKTALYHVMWVDDDGKQHLGDAYAEALTADKEAFLRSHPEISENELDEYLNFLLSWDSKKTDINDFDNEDDKKKALSKVRQDMFNAYRKGENFPLFDLSEHKPVLVPKVAAIQEYDEDDKPTMIFNSSDDALQYLADLSKKTIKIKQ